MSEKYPKFRPNNVGVAAEDKIGIDYTDESYYDAGFRARSEKRVSEMEGAIEGMDEELQQVSTQEREYVVRQLLDLLGPMMRRVSKAEQLMRVRGEAEFLRDIRHRLAVIADRVAALIAKYHIKIDPKIQV